MRSLDSVWFSFEKVTKDFKPLTETAYTCMNRKHGNLTATLEGRRSESRRSVTNGSDGTLTSRSCLSEKSLWQKINKGGDS